MFCVDNIEKSVNDVHSIEPIMVTITLAEYRELVIENRRLMNEVERLVEEREQWRVNSNKA